MSGELFDDPILRCIRTALLAIYGDRIERLVLFGSRARGDAHPDSDYDVAVFLGNLTDRWREFHRWQTSEPTFWPRRAPSWRRGRSGRVSTATARR